MAIKVCTGLGVATVAILNAVIMAGIFSKPKRELHGSAKFANMMDVKKPSLF